MLDGLRANRATLEKIKNSDLQGSNNPKIKVKMQYGTNYHASWSCSGYKEFEISSSYCSNPIRSGSGCAADCLVLGSTCEIVELKPDNDEAKSMGDKQKSAYEAGLRTWFDKNKDELFKKYPKVSDCVRDGQISTKSRRETYSFCPLGVGREAIRRGPQRHLVRPLGVRVVGLILGMQCVQDNSFPRDAVRQARLADLVVDPRWVYQFKLVTTTYMPGLPAQPQFPGVVAAARMRAAALESISSESVTSALFSVSKKDSLDHAHFDVRTGRDSSPSLSIRSNARWRVPEDADVDAAGASWVELQHAIIETLGVTHAVIVTATNEYVLNAEIWLSLTSLDGTVMHPRPDEISSYAARSHLLGDRWPRQNPRHREAAGGSRHRRALVHPAVRAGVGVDGRCGQGALSGIRRPSCADHDAAGGVTCGFGG